MAGAETAVQVEELLLRGVHSVYPSRDELRERLLSGDRLTAYMGVDPTGPDLHIGHESQLLKLRALQELGHDVVLLVGGFTGQIGDPTDKSAARQKLTAEQVAANAAGYVHQAGRILDFDPDSDNPARVVDNSEWLSGMSFAEVVELAGHFTVQQMLERRMFRTRIDDGTPVGLHEFLYPLMQGYDSVALETDIEVGGSDQIFNMLAGTTLVERLLGKQKYVLAGELLADPDGKKIGKTEGNMVTLSEPPLSKVAHVMRWGDGIAPHALELCTTMPLSQIVEIKNGLESGLLSPVDAKLTLAHEIVALIDGPDAAEAAIEGYHQITSGDVTAIDPSILAPAELGIGTPIIDILVTEGLARTKSEARRLLTQNGVRVNGVTVDMGWVADGAADGGILHVGKRLPENFRALHITEIDASEG